MTGPTPFEVRCRVDSADVPQKAARRMHLARDRLAELSLGLLASRAAFGSDYFFRDKSRQSTTSDMCEAIGSIPILGPTG